MTADVGGLESRLRALAADWGTFALGVADLTPKPVRDELAPAGGWVSSYPRGIAVAHRLQDALVDELPEHHLEAPLARLYDFHIYRTVNDLLDQVAERLAGEIQAAGYRALPVPTSLSVDPSGLRGALSHKLIAHLAGLGWIGRSCLLVTPTAGPRVRLVTVLTDAPLPPAGPTSRDCGRCHVCVDACPAGAFTGEPFRASEPVAARMDVEACQRYRQKAKETTGVAICGICVAVCPPGRRLRRSG